MNNKSKIQLKSENSNHNVINKLETISIGNGPRLNHANFKTLKNILICIICFLIGICITPTLIQNPNKNVFVTYSNTDSQNTNSKEKPAKSHLNRNVKEPKKSISKNPTYKKQKNKSTNSFEISMEKENIIPENENTNLNQINKIEYKNNFYGNSISNTLNDNFLAEEDNWFYYIDYNNYDYVYRTNILTEETELMLNIPCKEINILKNRLYAIPSNGNNSLIIYDLQTNQYSKTNVSERCLFVDFYYAISCNENGIFKSHTDGINKMVKEIYCGNIEKCVLYNQNIYFIESNNLYSMDPEGNNKILIQENVQNFAINNSEIYYTSNNQLYSTEKEESLYDISLKAINIFDNVIYFSNEKDNGKLYSININTCEIKKLSDEIAEKICVTANAIAIATPTHKIVFI